MALKKSFLWGNIAVSCMSAGTIAMAWIIEKQCSILPSEVSDTISAIIVSISVFAFMLSVLREIVKDMEDMEGDKLIHCRSLPIVKGLPFTKKVLILLVAITLVLLGITQVYLLHFDKTVAAIWLFLAVEIPLVYFLLKLQKAQSGTDFHSLSSMLKLIMVGGIASVIAGQF
jgi:4-hydroxybenzoate polyprenyltransferase